MKKTVFTLCVDDYAPEITALTFPRMEFYARKIGAELVVLRERKFPEWPVTYEKFQVYSLAREMGSEWNIFFDADCLVHPDLPDVTAHLRKDTVMQNANDLASGRFVYDAYMQRDGRNLSSCNWFCVFSDLCLDIYHPLEDLTQAQALSNIFPCQKEVNYGIDAAHLIDDYVVTRNIARYGLKHTTWTKVQEALGGPFFWLWHSYLQSNEDKAEGMRRTLVQWKCVPSPIMAVPTLTT